MMETTLNGLQPRTSPRGLGGVTCPSCGEANAPGRKFCGACGGPFYEPCLECESPTLVGERFCGSCGLNFDDACEERQQRASEDLSRAKQLRDEADFDQALAILQPWAETEFSRLADVALQARELRQATLKRREQAPSHVATCDTAATDAIAQHRWREAVAALEAIPRLLRTKAHETALTKVSEAVRELDHLHSEIRGGVKSGRTLGLIPRVERVLELDPSNQQMKSLLDKLRRRQWQDTRDESIRLQQEAQHKLDAFQYVEAAELLASAPPEVTDDEFKEVQAKANELAFLWTTLRHSPLASGTLVDLCGRLQKLAPGDARLSKLKTQLRQRLAQKKSPCDVVPWAKAPAVAAVGCPIRSLTTYGSMDVQAVVGQPIFSRNSSRFFAAAGAALQGVGKAAINTDLLPPASEGWFPSLTSRTKVRSSAWGIDLSDSGLKAVKLKCDAKSGQLSIVAFDLIDHAAALGEALTLPQRRDVLAASLDQFATRNAIKKDVVCATLSGCLTLGRFFCSPPVEKKLVDNMMRLEAQQQFPIPLAQLLWDHHIFSSESLAQSQRHSLLLAARKQSVTSLVSLFEDRQMRLDWLQSDCVALYNFYRATLKPAIDVTRLPTVALLDVGADHTNFVVCGADNIWFRTVPRGSGDCTAAIARRQEVSFSSAEQLKREPAKARCVSRLHDAWSPVYQQVLKETRDSVAAYERLHPNRPIEMLYCCGGGFQAIDLQRQLLGM